MKTCESKGCPLKYHAKGFCQSHYLRDKKGQSVEVPVKTQIFHGLSKHPLQATWVNMHQRCNNPNSPVYSHYGGRGIGVCDRWSSLVNFVEDMGDKPSSQHSIDRIDNDGDYSPENCRWATKKEQSQNQRMRSNNTSGTTGVTWNKLRQKWVAQLTIDGRNKSLGYFIHKQDAITARRAVNYQMTKLEEWEQGDGEL